MKNVVEFSINQAPRGKERPRFSRGHAYTPKKTVEYEQAVKAAASEAMGGSDMLSGPILANVTAWFAIPKSWSKAKCEAAKSGLVLVTTKPDIDNIIKAVFDACNGVVFLDDKQVVGCHCFKKYGDGPGRVAVRFECLYEKISEH